MSAAPAVDYKLLFESMPKGFIAVQPDDPHFTIVAVSGSRSAYGTSARDDVVGKPLLESYPDSSDQFKRTGKSEIIEAYRKVLTTKQPYSTEALRYDVQEANGSYVQKYWKTNLFPILDTKGKVQLLCAVSEDITDSASAQNKLALAQSRLDEVMAIGLIGTWQWDVVRGAVTGGKNMARMFGLSVAEAAAGMSFDTFVARIYPADRTRFKNALKTSLRTKTAFKCEHRTVAADNSIRWMLAQAKPTFDDKSKPISYQALVIDITERKLVENNLSYLAKASAVLSASLDYKKTLQAIAKLMVPDIADWCSIEILDENHQLQQVAVAHKDPEKVTWAKQLRKQQGPPNLDEPTGSANVIRTGKPEYYPVITDEVLVMSAKNKEELELLRSLALSSIIIVPLKVSNQTVGVVSLILTDQKRYYTELDLEMAEELANRASLAMTNASLYDDVQKELAERARLEEQLRVANEQLERRVKERTEQLGETNLSLQRSNQELQDFAYVASHDLQEPLRKIQAFGNLLEEEYGGHLGDGKDYLLRMRGAAARMSALIEDILAFSRVTTKARGFTTVNLNHVIKEVLGDLETRIQDTKAVVTMDKMPSIHADPMQMRQLCQNLISNALKFHKPGVAPIIHIGVRTEISQSDHRKYCKLSVEDNGVGFDEKYLDRIFAVFQRLHSRDAYEGTGIGLAVCRKIVERHGGSITATSKLGKGTTFIVTLPTHHKKGETL